MPASVRLKQNAPFIVPLLDGQILFNELILLGSAVNCALQTTKVCSDVCSFHFERILKTWLAESSHAKCTFA